MSKNPACSHEINSTIVLARSWRKFLLLAIVYMAIEFLAYYVLSAYFRGHIDAPIAYLDWAFYFYFPEKKIAFYYFLTFLVTTWAYAFSLDVYLNLLNKD